MVKIKFRYRVLMAFFSVILIPLIVTGGFAYFYGKHLFSPVRESFYLTSEKVELLNSFIIDNWDLLDPVNKDFHNGIIEIIDNAPVILRIVDNSGKLLYSSVEDNFTNHYQLLTEVIPGLEKNRNTSDNEILSYTVGEYIYISGEIVGVKLYTYPPPPDFIPRLTKFLIGTVSIGLTSLLLHIVLSVYLISRRVTQPFKELNMAIEKISKNDFDFDITYNASDELGNLCQAFQIMKNKLKEVNQKEKEITIAKKQLLAAISHDLRTPLTSIKGYVEALKDGLFNDPKTFNNYLAIISNKVDNLSILIDDLFNLAKLDLDQLEFNFEKVNVKTFVQSYYLDIKEEGSWHDKLISKQLVNLDSAFIYVDPTRLEQVLNNLFFNALEYSKKEIVFQCYLMDKKVFLNIIDDGPGIPEEDLPHIFEKFYKVEKSRSSKGSGLGLAIAKGITEKMGGKIEVFNNKRSPGCTFSISFPLVN
ncbi:HAMP domain-containing sensor histidine kinase [Anaerobranca gottschalkii]|uniref:histidine kinase n=1 Tax=Anaerobranca gottschalkii DSM 13577 TaxID=1120990 RepID=A0A1I0AMS5_9FIRM|nr:HAMP domain-containing sensor histidine kinase [Anaerobranca gottschalkii]SES94688.1 HAMP domain-containing protein [Anaerobranca gottschalkii DSM 13577]